MSAARRISKKQLKEDRFVETVAEYAEKMKENQRLIIGVLVAILVIIFGTNWTINYRKALESESQEAFTSCMSTLNVAMESGEDADYEAAVAALESLRSEFQGREVADWALYFIGFCQERTADYLTAIDTYERYLAADDEYAISAKAGIAACNGGVGRLKVQADTLVELARSGDVVDPQAESWLYKASQIYLDEGYFDEARALLTELAEDADLTLKRKVEADLNALAARGS